MPHNIIASAKRRHSNFGVHEKSPTEKCGHQRGFAVTFGAAIAAYSRSN